MKTLKLKNGKTVHISLEKYADMIVVFACDEDGNRLSQGDLAFSLIRKDG